VVLLATESLVDGVDVNSLERDSHPKSWRPNWLRLGKPQLEHSGEDWQDDASMREQWRTIVEEYTDCELTFNSDKLIALAGISARHQMLLNHQHEGKIGEGLYLAGLWGSDILSGLLWHVRGSTSGGIPTLSPRSSVYRAPSWP
jgi:hypothetical protein